jgi:magnesium chelatase family protein
MDMSRVSRVRTAALLGVDGVPVEVEVRISSQLPRVEIVGLPEAAVRESAARVRAALAAAGEKFPDRRVTVHLAPAELRKSGAALDLPIAVALLAASGQIEPGALDGVAFVGELALDGRLRAVRGALALALAVRDAGCATLIAPRANTPEAALAQPLDVRAASDLIAVLAHLRGGDALPIAPLAAPAPPDLALPDLAEVRGQELAKRGLEIAAAGRHAALLVGAPGAGKTMLARRLPGFLPDLTRDEAIEVARIHGSIAPLEAPLATHRPFRAPHHTASAAGLIGGGRPPQPGEVSLAHCGVLFLDELPEFERRALESLRQVVEDHRVVLVRAGRRVTFPANFQLVAAANPCPCGWLGSGRRDCRCDEGQVARYQSRISGPLLDRIDLHLHVRPVAWAELEAEPTPGAASAAVRERVARARRHQARRGAIANARLPDANLDTLVDATAEARALLGRAVDGFGLSARAARRVLRVARTIADLADEVHTGVDAVAEALGYRSDAGPRTREPAATSEN